MAEHFDHFEPVLTRKRWLFWAKEATSHDINLAALDWLEQQRRENPSGRFAVWVHYVEPHGPYEAHEEFAQQLGVRGGLSGKSNRYDSEVAFVDARIGEFLEEFDQLTDSEERLIAFTADHGESLGEHGYWGHGRHCYEARPANSLWLRSGRVELSRG